MLKLNVTNFKKLGSSVLQSPDIFIKITCLFWLITKFICYKAWFAERLYPVVPAFEFAETMPAIVHGVLFYLSITLLVVLLFFSNNKLMLIALLASEICSCFLDVLRWQPWEYQFIFTLIIYLINKNNSKNLYSVFIFLLASIYIYSGLHKINSGFLHTIWQSMILKRFMGLSAITIFRFKLYYLGLIAPAVEIFGGLALLFFKNIKAPALLLIGMHLFILWFLGPLGLNYNPVIWPWNALMACFLYIVAFRNPFTISFKPVLQGYNKMVFLFWGILPVLSFIGLWDSFLSSSLYSGNAMHIDICMDKVPGDKALVHYFAKSDRRNICYKQARLPLTGWAMAETNVPPYPENWYCTKFKKIWIAKYKNSKDKFIVYTYPYKVREEIR